MPTNHYLTEQIVNLYALLSAALMISGALISTTTYTVFGVVIIFVGLIALIASISINLYKNNRVGFYNFAKSMGIVTALVALFTAINLFS